VVIFRHSKSVVGGLDFFEEVGGQMRPIREKDGVYSTVNSSDIKFFKIPPFSTFSPNKQCTFSNGTPKICPSLCSSRINHRTLHCRRQATTRKFVRPIFMILKEWFTVVSWQ
jgi:hypothetical protein